MLRTRTLEAPRRQISVKETI